MRQTWLIKGFPFKFERVDPSASDVAYSDAFVWVNIITNIAYMLFDGAWVVKNPDSIINEGIGQINVIGETALGDVIKTPGVVAVPIPVTGVASAPSAGEYRVTGIRVGPDKKMIVTYDETPI